MILCVKQLIYNCIFVSFISFIALSELYSQQSVAKSADEYLESRGEVYFKFFTNPENINLLSRQISIDKITGDTIFAYANRKEFSRFLEYGIQYVVLVPPSLQYRADMARKASDLKDWDSYPGYTVYLEMMAAFADNYPGLCTVHEFGTSIEGRKLLVAKISDNADSKEAEPEFLLTSSMHGDELTGYILCLRLIDYLLQNYETDPLIKRLVDSVEIWINPLSNPDGTYAGGDNSVTGATRNNANFVDLNRNYPDPEDGTHPDGEEWQVENIAMMNFLQAHNFVFSANYHGGAEVMNYPWDTYYKRHPDDIWFQHVALAYADTVKKYGGSDYFSDISDDGITNGYDWYTISGGRQDYMTYFCHGREITIEVSEIKLPSAASLPDYWNYNHSAMLHYIENCLYGIRGIVTDSANHQPIRAHLEVVGFDADNSQVYGDSINGNFHRMIESGIYDLIFSSPGYKEALIENVLVDNYKSQVWLDVELSEGDNPISVHETEEDLISCNVDNDLNLILKSISEGNLSVSIYTINGNLMYSTSTYKASTSVSIPLPAEKMDRGLYICQVNLNGKTKNLKFNRF